MNISIERADVKAAGYFCFIILAIFIFSHPPATAKDDPFRGPWNDPSIDQKKGKRSLNQNDSNSGSILQKIGTQSIKFFQTVISPADGDRCPMYPSCSAYGIEAMRKHGFFLGFIMTAARLTHEKGEMQISPKIRIDDSYRFYDPVENNDFWFDRPKTEKEVQPDI